MSNTPDNTEMTLDKAISDHRSGKPPQTGNDLSYPFDDIPVDQKVVEVASGVLWARIPLPWSLNHINVYLLDEGDSWTLIDTGAQGDRGRSAWEALEAEVLKGKPIKHIVATHMHPDHLGLAGWIAQRHDATLSITQSEYLLAQHLWHGAKAEIPEAELKFLFSNGVDRSYEEKIRSAGFGNFKKGVHELPYSYQRMEDGSILSLGGRDWKVVVGRGHSPEHACLECLDEPLFISGDQVLPQITSNVSVYAREPRANPLAHWLTSLDRMRGVNSDPVVLPSHGRVFKGLHARLDSLILSHDQKLRKVHDWCKQPRTPVETFPALFRRKITGFDFFMALGEAIAHLHLLESLDLLDRIEVEGVYQFAAKGNIEAADILEQSKALPGVALRPL